MSGYLRYAASLLTAWVAEAAAQGAASPPTELEKVEIVGSHIPRIEGETAAPVTVIRRQDIEASGVTRVSELLLALPYVNSGSSFDDRATLRAPSLGAAGISLRGLGIGATLILLNGRRIVPYGLAEGNDESFVDLNSLPLAAVDRIEILRDGASAIYGADALAGVINIVLRRDFTGAETALQWSRSTRGDAGEWSGSLTLGHGDLRHDGYNVFATVDLMRRDALQASDRDFSRTSDQRPRGGQDYRSAAGSPPTALLSDGTYRPGPGCAPDRITPAPDGGTICAYNNNERTQLLPKAERGGVLVVGTSQLSDETTAFVELAFNRTRTAGDFAPTGVFGYPMLAGAATNPFGEDVLLFWRIVEMDPRRFESTIDFTRAVAGLRGRAGLWDWEVAGGYNSVDTDYRRLNDLPTDATFAALDAGLIDPFGTSNAAALNKLRVETRDLIRGTLSFVQGKGTTVLTNTTHGPIAMAIGGELRRETFRTRLDPLTIAGNLTGSPAGVDADASGARSVEAFFAELSVPLARDLEAQLAGRVDQYSDFGHAFSPKLALRWKVQPGLLLRGSAGRGFLPPSLFQLNRPTSSFTDLTGDPVRCPVTHLDADCRNTVIEHFNGGNPALTAERSTQYNAGLVLEPVDGVSISVDAWRIDHRDKIVFAGGYLIANEALYPDRVIRAPASAADIALGIPGPIIELRDTYINLARQQVRGVDVELKARSNASRYGSVTLGAAASYVDWFAIQVTPDGPFEQVAGDDGNPRLKANASMLWEFGRWHADLAAHYVSSYQYFNGSEATPRTMASMTTFDVAVGVNIQSAQVTLLVRNVFDRQPPFRDFVWGYDPLVHDPRGRIVSLSARYAF